MFRKDHIYSLVIASQHFYVYRKITVTLIDRK